MKTGSSCSEVFCKKGVLRILQNSQENTYARVSFLIKLQAEAEACNFIEKETLAQVFSCGFRKISKNTFFTEHLRVTASGKHLNTNQISENNIFFLEMVFNYISKYPENYTATPSF